MLKSLTENLRREKIGIEEIVHEFLSQVYEWMSQAAKTKVIYEGRPDIIYNL